MLRSVLTLILAGGKGTRLEPLTRDRAKPAVPFGGLYRIIDFTLSNCINSGLRRVFVLTQLKSRSLDRHIRLGWNFLSPELNEWIEVLPPQQRIDEHWYKGTADALYQNIYTIEKDNPEHLLVLAGDHIYKMDYSEMIRTHVETKADLTIGCLPVPISECRHFGIMTIDAQNRLVSFQEKPRTTTPLPDMPDHALGSMGIYVFNTHHLFELLCENAAKPNSGHDFGKDIIPAMISSGYRVFGHRFWDDKNKRPEYWRDVGTLDAYYQANIDLIEVEPALNLYDSKWPIRTLHPESPPPKFIFSGEGPLGHVRRGEAHDSMICPGCIISGGHVSKSILSPKVRVNSFSVVQESILLEGVDVGRHCRIRRAIIDKDVKIPPNTVIGFDPEFDRQRGFTISDNGVVIIPKNEPIENFQSPNPSPW